VNVDSVSQRRYQVAHRGGATIIPRNGESFSQLVQTADAALYEAKESGKNRVVTREPGYSGA
jgi:PleD family two-component response regulator